MKRKTKHDYKKIYEDQNKLGISANKMADNMGIPRSSYYSAIRRLGFVISRKRSANKDEKQEKMKAMLKRIDPIPIASKTIEIPEMVQEIRKEVSVVIIKGDADDVLKILSNML